MPRIEDPPREVPIRALSPGTPFLMPPGGDTSGGVFLDMIGGDAEVLLGERTTYWSSETLVYRDSRKVVPVKIRPVITREERAKIQQINTGKRESAPIPFTCFGSEG